MNTAYHNYKWPKEANSMPLIQTSTRMQRNAPMLVGTAETCKEFEVTDLDLSMSILFQVYSLSCAYRPVAHCFDVKHSMQRLAVFLV